MDLRATFSLESSHALAFTFKAIPSTRTIVGTALEMARGSIPTRLAHTSALNTKPSFVTIALAHWHVTNASSPTCGTGTCPGIFTTSVATTVCFTMNCRLIRWLPLQERCSLRCDLSSHPSGSTYGRGVCIFVVWTFILSGHFTQQSCSIVGSTESFPGR